MSKFSLPTRDQLRIDKLQAQFGHLVDQLLHGGINTPPLDGQDWAPRIEVREEADRFIVHLDVPGVDRSSLDVAAYPKSIVVRGEKLSPPGRSADMSVVQSERSYGSFKRQIQLPGEIQVDAVEASLADGVLEITLPKATVSTRVNVKVNVDQAAGDHLP